ncbi:MAG: pyruvate ferredoxin oxidoreductase, partial [Nitrospirota bacterium]
GMGPLYAEISGALINLKKKPLMINKIYGLGGRDYLPDQAEQVLNELIEIAETGNIRITKEYIGLR